MPASAYALVVLFFAISIAAACLAAWVVGPRRPWTVVVPAVATFGALYLVGHRLVLQVGPEVELFGWQVSLPFDLAIALGAAFAAAAAQRLGVRLLQPQQRDAGRDGLA